MQALRPKPAHTPHPHPPAEGCRVLQARWPARQSILEWSEGGGAPSSGPLGQAGLVSPGDVPSPPTAAKHRHFLAWHNAQSPQGVAARRPQRTVRASAQLQTGSLKASKTPLPQAVTAAHTGPSPRQRPTHAPLTRPAMLGWCPGVQGLGWPGPCRRRQGPTHGADREWGACPQSGASPPQPWPGVPAGVGPPAAHLGQHRNPTLVCYTQSSLSELSLCPAPCPALGEPCQLLLWARKLPTGQPLNPSPLCPCTASSVWGP